LKCVDGTAFIAEAGNLLFCVLVRSFDGHGWKTIQLSLVEDGARFSEPGTCDADAVIGAECAFNQRIEDGIVKLFPPASIKGRVINQCGIRGMVLDRRGLRRSVARADSTAVYKKQRNEDGYKL
jgi:hypothetical protein